MTKNERRLLEWLGSKKGSSYHDPLEKSYQFGPLVTGPLVEAGEIEGNGSGGFRKIGKVKRAIKGKK